jgi:cell shape-determining protein MreC
MKMMYQIKRTKRPLFGNIFFKTPGIFILIAVLVLIIVIFSPVRSLVGGMASPLLQVGNFFYSTFDRVPKFFEDKNKLLDENERLQNEIDSHQIKVMSFETINYENQRLRDELKLKPTENFITAGIMARPPQIPMDSLFLDKGSKDGIKSGSLVLAGERILIGKVVEMSRNKATVALSSAADAVSYGYVARTDESLEIKGKGGGGLEVKVPIDFDIVVGDKIMVHGSFNYLAAVVLAIAEDRSSGFKNVMMSLPIDISKIDIVFISNSINE